MPSTEYKNYTINIHQDECPQSPREWDNLGTMVCFHRDYALGDKHDLSTDDFNSWDDVYNYIKKELKGYVILPLYLYDHSGITMSTSRRYPFNCKWDSMQVGFIYITGAKIRKEYTAKRISKKLKKKIIDNLISEVKTYDMYLTGNVWGYTIEDPEGNECDDSCWGFYGYEYCLEDAKGIVDWYVKEAMKKRIEKIKAWIKNKVPLRYRNLATI